MVAFFVTSTAAIEAHADVSDPTQLVSPKRPLPAYDGRQPPRPPESDNLLWIPRFLLAPVYLVHEYVIRRPLAVAVPAAEKVDLFTKAYDFFVFGADHKAGILPVALAEFDFKPSVGFYAFWNDAGFKGNDLSLHTEAWPDDWFAATLRQRISVGSDRTLQFQISEIHRPDLLFYGIGPNTLEANESRYGVQHVEADAAHEWRFWRSSRIETRLGVRDVHLFDGDNWGGDPSLAEEAAKGTFPLPAGFNGAYTAVFSRIVAALDTRVSESRRGSGVRLELDGEQGSDVRNNPGSSWLQYGATAAGYVDLNGHRRVLSLALMTQFSDPLGSTAIPFTELVYLGGDHAMPGFFKGRLLGRSAAVATASYMWPIGPWIDGDLQFSVGNVFDEHLEDFEGRLLRFSSSIGFAIGGLQKTAVMGSQDAPVKVLVGIGSETFEHGGQVDSVRVMLGVPHSF